jgi:hypothetical protein
LHPTLIRNAPIGRYYYYEDSRIRLRASDQTGLDDFGVWTPAVGNDWTPVLLWSPYADVSERPQTWLPGDWISYLRTLSVCRSRELLVWRATHYIHRISQGIAVS